VLKQVKVANYTTEGGPWKAVSGDAKAFVKSCMSRYPANRVSATTALEDHWITDCEDIDDAAGIGALELSGLKTFSRMNHLKKAAVTVVATQLTSEKIEKLRGMFMQMDNNSDGTLSISELKAGLEWSGIACPSDLDALLKEADTDGSGVVDYTEFLAATMDKKLYYQEDVVWTAFKKFDLNGSGSIDRQELAKVLCDENVAEALHLGDADDGNSQQLLDDTFATVDSNGDGLIDFDEFLKMMRQHEGKQERKSPVKQESQGGAEAAAGASPRSRASPGSSPRSRRRTSEASRARERSPRNRVDAAEEAGGGARKGRRSSKKLLPSSED
jgi:calcium-dependent protein kinase